MSDLSEVFGKKPKRKKNPFAADTVPDPMASVEYSSFEPDVESDSKLEAAAVLAAFKRRRKDEDRRFMDATDSEFWVAFCFRNRDDKERFLKLAKLAQLGDKYIDGHKAAQVLGVDLGDGGAASI